MKSILDPKFRYTPSIATDIRKTFARARRQMAKAQEPPLNIVINMQERSKRK